MSAQLPENWEQRPLVCVCVQSAASQQLCLAPLLQAALAEKCWFSNLWFSHYIYRWWQLLVDDSLWCGTPWTPWYEPNINTQARNRKPFKSWSKTFIVCILGTNSAAVRLVHENKCAYWQYTRDTYRIRPDQTAIGRCLILGQIECFFNVQKTKGVCVLGKRG